MHKSVAAFYALNGNVMRDTTTKLSISCDSKETPENLEELWRWDALEIILTDWICQNNFGQRMKNAEIAREISNMHDGARGVDSADVRAWFGNNKRHSAA